MSPDTFSERLQEVYSRLSGAYGYQDWWPGESPFEIMVGAVLTQNTSWSNVERAIANLRAAEMLQARTIVQAEPEALADVIRPAGYFNIKARRLQNLCRFLLDHDGEAGLAHLGTTELRRRLLMVNGVGPETADDILLYAFGRPVFVIDAYTRRIFQRLGLIAGNETYEALRGRFEAALGPDVPTFSEYHGLIVRHAKLACKKRPLCKQCALANLCPESREAAPDHRDPPGGLQGPRSGKGHC